MVKISQYIENNFKSVVVIITLIGIIIYFIWTWSMLKNYVKNIKPVINPNVSFIDKNVPSTTENVSSTPENVSSTIENVSSINENEIKNGIDSIYSLVDKNTSQVTPNTAYPDAGSGVIDFTERRREHIDRVIFLFDDK
jgi:hypothetical protein